MGDTVRPTLSDQNHLGALKAIKDVTAVGLQVVIDHTDLHGDANKFYR